MNARLRCSLAAALLLVTAATGRAQNVPLADSLGANFDTEHPGTAGPDLFDYLVGEWSFRFQTINQNGVLGPARNGHWRAWKSHDGMMVEDEWIVDPPPGQPPRITISYRAWNPQRHLWEMVGVVPGQGTFDPGIAWGSGDRRMIVQHYGTFTARILYYAITPNHFLWRADGSNDSGRTWTKDVWRMEATRTR